MAVLSLSEMPKLKELTNRFGYNIHLHDACGGQSFTLEPVSGKLDEKIYTELDNFFSKHKMTISFYDKDKLNFVAK